MTDEEKLIEAAYEALGGERDTSLQKALALRERGRDLRFSATSVAEAAEGLRLSEEADSAVDAARARAKPPPRTPDWAEALGLSEEESREIAGAPLKWHSMPVKVAR